MIRSALSTGNKQHSNTLNLNKIRIKYIDETTIEIRLASYKNWHKTTDKLNCAAGDKIGKPKHSNVKIHLLGGISPKGLMPLDLW